MQAVEMFAEQWPNATPGQLPSIMDAIGGPTLPDADQVTLYLKSGHTLMSMMDVDDDIVDGAETILSGCSILTDGSWMWRKDLEHYVRRHNLRLPDNLLANIRSNNYQVPSIDPAARPEYVSLAKQYLRSGHL